MTTASAKKVEVSEEDYLRFQALDTTVGKMLKHPKGKLLVQEAHKLVDPNAQTPDLDAQKPLDERFKAQEDQIAALKKSIEDRETKEEADKIAATTQKIIDDGFAKLRAQKWTEEGIKGVRELMDKNGIVDPVIAASYFEKLHPPADPVVPQAPGSGPWNFMEQPKDNPDEFVKQLLDSKGDDAGMLADREARKVLGEVRNNRSR